MRFSLLRAASAALVLSLLAARADAQNEDQQKQPLEEIPDFSNLDEFVRVPTSTLAIGFRSMINGPKASFRGHGYVPSTADAGPANVPNISHTYWDGNVQPDSRSTTVDNGNGTSTVVPNAPDGKTDSWTYTLPSQYKGGLVSMNTYSAEVNDSTSHTTRGAPGADVELTSSKEMGKIGKRATWGLMAGFSISDLRASKWTSVDATITTITDTYKVYGQTSGLTPGTYPQIISQPTGTPDLQQVLISNEPTTRTVSISDVPNNGTSQPSIGGVENRYTLEGAYYTLRFGPTLFVPFGNHFSVTLGAGGALIYSGATFEANQFYFPEEGQVQGTSLITEEYTYQKENTKILPGFYVDVDARYDINDTTGIYLGGLYQGAGSYTQSLPSGNVAGGAPANSNYEAHINLGNQAGFRAGMSLKF